MKIKLNVPFLSSAVDPEVLSIAQESHQLNPDLVLSCQVNGYPITEVVWSMTTSILPPAEVIPLVSGPVAMVMENREACMVTSTLKVSDLAGSCTPNTNITFICSASFHKKKAMATSIVKVRK